MRHWLWACVLILFGSFALRLAAVPHGLPYIHNVDEPNFYLLANAWRGALDGGYRLQWLAGYPPGFIWWYEHVLRFIDSFNTLNIHTDMAAYVGTMRFASVLVDTLTLALLMMLAHWLGNKWASILVGCIYATSAEIILNSMLALPDAPTVFLTTLTAVLGMKALRSQRWQWGIAATIAGLLAITFKYPVFPILIMPALFFLQYLWRQRLKALPASALALLLVAGVAFYLLVINGASSLNNVEGLQVRSGFFTGLVTPYRWQLALTALWICIGTIGVAVLLMGGISLMAGRKLPQRGFILVLLLIGAAIFTVVPGYHVHSLFPTRYIWPAIPLLLASTGAALMVLLVRFKRPIWRWLPVALALVAGLPTAVSFVETIQRPFTYTLAQAYFEENIPDGSSVWVESFRGYRTMGRYEAGYHGYKNFATVYSSETRFDADQPPQYIYLEEPSLRRNNIPDLDAYLLLKHISSMNRNGTDLYIYSTHGLPLAREIAFNGQQTRLLLRGADVQQQGRVLSVTSFW